MKPFIVQQESYVPEGRRPKKIDLPRKKPRGRPKSYMTLRRLIFQRALYVIRTSGKRYSREEFAALLGLNPKAVNTMSAAFQRIPDEENERLLELQNKIDKSFCKPKNLTAVPIYTPEEIMRRDYSIKTPLTKLNAVTMEKEPKYGWRMHYFAMIMPDNCMLHDGICKGDKIIAARNVRPGHGDLVVCRIPEINVITVRRYAVTCNSSLFDLYEGGTINPFIITEMENLIYGVVVGIERNYWPIRLPRPWEPVR